MKITNLQTIIASGFLSIMGLGFNQINWNIPGILFIVAGLLGFLSVFIYSFVRAKGNFFKKSFSCISTIFSSDVFFSFISQQIKSNIIDSFSPTLSELKLHFEEYPSTGTNLDAVSTRKTYDIIKDHIKNQRETVESLRAHLSPNKQIALDEAWKNYAEPQKAKVPSDAIIEYWGMDEETARKTAIERIKKILEFVR